MKVEELQPESNFDKLKVRVFSKQGPRQVQSRDRTLFVWDILVLDETGTTTLTLWGRDTGEKYKVGDVVEIENGGSSGPGGVARTTFHRERRNHHEEKVQQTRECPQGFQEGAEEEAS